MGLKYQKIAKKLSSKIQKVHDENPGISDRKLAVKIVERFNLEVTPDYLRAVIRTWKALVQQNKTDELEEESKSQPVKEKTGLELRDNYVINWSDKTMVTDLGVFGSYICSIDRHMMIQRKYVYDDGNETAAIVAMEFDFAHTKAVYVYARIHGFSKASPPQTDIEFELGKSVNESVEENIQTIKRNVYKKTQKRKWKETVDAADKWWNLEDTVIEAIKALSFELQSENVESLQFVIPDSDYKFAAFVGITDAHYLKLCYNHSGEVMYNKEIAKKRIQDHVQRLATEASRYGRPERFYVTCGNDNIHVDGMHHSTTKLTPQHQATDGLWRLELKNYIKIQIDLINYYKQIAPVTVLPVKGNHDYETSIAVQAFMEVYFEKDPLVEVQICHDARVYIQYHKVCMIATHGDELGSVKNLESQAHKLIMGEAKDQGIDVMEVEYYILFHGHEHVGSSRDLNGRVQRIGLSSLSGIDDWWHKEKGFVGRQPESQLIIVDRNTGRKAILYVQ
jgi:hypothetical protein